MLRKPAKWLTQRLLEVSSLGIPKGEHLIRYTMYRRIAAEARHLDPGERVLAVSGSTHLCRVLGAKAEHITEIHYPETDICQTGLPSGSYTAVVSDQVLEHVADHPGRAVDEVHRLLVPGGIAVHTTCFLTPYHGSPDPLDRTNGDYWRFTPSGLRLLHAKYSRIIAADGWGNPFMNVLNGLGIGHMKVPLAKWHPLNRLAAMDWKSHAFTVWIIARK